MGPSDPHDGYCQKLARPEPFNFALSLLIFIGILISYLPQHIRIISLRSSFGISPYFILLGTTSGTSAFANILVLPRSTRDAACCKEISGLACFAGLLGILQVAVQWSSFFIILILFIVYFPRASSPASPTSPSAKPLATDSLFSYRTAVLVTIICVVHAVIIVITSIFIVVTQPSHLQAWANVLGIMAAVLTSIQYFPQIYTTFRLRRVGSLSIPMMCIQTPGSIVWAASLAARLGTEGWSTWGVYVVTAVLQGSLLAMSVYFEYVSPQKSVSDGTPSPEGGENESDQDREPDQDWQASEETPLLQSR